jgi:hypothetical protein
MTKKYKNLNESFDLPENFNDEEEKVTEVSIIKKDLDENESLSEKKELNNTNIEDIKHDYEYTRGNLYSLIEKGQEAINGILELAQESEMPRAYEVAGQLIKSVADTTDKLMDLQKKLKEVEEGKQAKGPTNVTNALFVGSTADLAKFIKQQSKNE